MVDETGQTHQQRAYFRNDGKWQNLTLKPLKWSPTSWGGAGDGKWHGKLKSLMFLAEGIALVDKTAGQGSLYFNKISIETP